MGQYFVSLKSVLGIVFPSPEDAAEVGTPIALAPNTLEPTPTPEVLSYKLFAHFFAHHIAQNIDLGDISEVF